jgi:hypothetical protein
MTSSVDTVDISSDRLLRSGLTFNGWYSIMSGMATAGFAGALTAFMEVPTLLLVVVGLGLVGFGVLTLMNARGDRVDAAQARMITVSDFGWILGVVVLQLGFPDALSSGGKWLLAGVSVPVAVFAIIQWLGLRAKGRDLELRTLVTDITIDASPEKVWDVLTELDTFSEWNPFMIEARGVVAVGEHLEVKMKLPGGSATRIRPTVTVVEPGGRFEWLGHLGVRGLFDGRHRFELQKSSGGTRLIQSEVFTGILAPIFARLLGNRTKEGFETMNAALAARTQI